MSIMKFKYIVQFLQQFQKLGIIFFFTIELTEDQEILVTFQDYSVKRQ